MTAKRRMPSAAAKQIASGKKAASAKKAAAPKPPAEKSVPGKKSASGKKAASAKKAASGKKAAAPKPLAEKPVPAKKAAGSKRAAPRKVAAKPPAKGAPEVPRLSAAQRAATAADNLARAARRASKRGRAAERAAYSARLTEGIDRHALSGAMARVLAAQDAAAAGPAARTRTRRAASRAAPGTGEVAGQPIRRWVPIGPSVVRSGQAIDRPRVSGRIRALAVEPAAGLRAYAGAATGGVWYTSDGGLTWSPLGGWSQRSRRQGGIVGAQAVGSLLVSFGVTQAQDVVMVGTGDYPVVPPPVSAVVPTVRGVGVLVGSRPVVLGANEPWEADSGLTQLETTSVLKLVRSPAAVPGKSGAAAVADRDVVVACTTQGAYVGVRQPLAAGGGLPARDGFVWGQMAGLAAAYPNATIHDAVWLAGGRLYLTVFGVGLVYTDDLGVTIQNVPSLQAPAVAVRGAASLAVGAANTLYFLGDGGGAPGLWRIPNAVGPAVPAATAAGGVPAGLWGTQRDYDQAIAVDAGAGPAGADRVYLGGSTVKAHAWRAVGCVAVLLRRHRTCTVRAATGPWDLDDQPAVVPRRGVYGCRGQPGWPDRQQRPRRRPCHRPGRAWPPAGRSGWATTAGCLCLAWPGGSTPLLQPTSDWRHCNRHSSEGIRHRVTLWPPACRTTAPCSDPATRSGLRSTSATVAGLRSSRARRMCWYASTSRGPGTAPRRVSVTR